MAKGDKGPSKVKSSVKSKENLQKICEAKNLLDQCELSKGVNIEDNNSLLDLLIKLLSDKLSKPKTQESIDENKSREEEGVRGGGGEGARLGGESRVGEGWTESVSLATKSQLKILSTRVRKNEDYTDFIHQRSIKGKIIVVSPNNPDKNLKTLIKDPSELKGETYLEQMIRLIKLYYDVDIKPSDIINCHPTKQPGCAIIVFGNRNIGSAFARLSQAIKTGGVKKDGSNSERKGYTGEEGATGENKEGPSEGASEGASQGASEGASDGASEGVSEGDLEGGNNIQTERGEKSKNTSFQRPNFWLTFQMTTRRSALIKKLKELKKNNKIYKFNSDENGEISFIRKKDGPRFKLTMDWLDENSKTYTVEELVKLF